MDLEAIESANAEIKRVKETIEYFKQREELLENGFYRTMIDTRQKAQVTTELLRDIKKYSFKMLSMFTYLINPELPEGEGKESSPFTAEIEAKPEPAEYTAQQILSANGTETSKSRTTKKRRLSVADYIKSTQPGPTLVRPNRRTTVTGQASLTRRSTVNYHRTKPLQTVFPELLTKTLTQAQAHSHLQRKAPMAANIETLAQKQAPVHQKQQRQTQHSVSDSVTTVYSSSNNRAVSGNSATPCSTSKKAEKVKLETRGRIKHNADYPKPWLDPPNSGSTSNNNRDRLNGKNEPCVKRNRTAFPANRYSVVPGTTRKGAHLEPRPTPLPTLIPHDNLLCRPLTIDAYTYQSNLHTSNLHQRLSVAPSRQAVTENSQYPQEKEAAPLQQQETTSPSRSQQRRRTVFRPNLNTILQPTNLLSTTYTVQESPVKQTPQPAQETTAPRGLLTSLTETNQHASNETIWNRPTAARPYWNSHLIIPRLQSAESRRTQSIKSTINMIRPDSKLLRRGRKLNSIFIRNTLNHRTGMHRVLGRIPKKP